MRAKYKQGVLTGRTLHDYRWAGSNGSIEDRAHGKDGRGPFCFEMMHQQAAHAEASTTKLCVQHALHRTAQELLVLGPTGFRSANCSELAAGSQPGLPRSRGGRTEGDTDCAAASGVTACAGASPVAGTVGAG